MAKICDIYGCNREVKACGLCGVHYQRRRAHGDPFIVKNSRGKAFYEEVREDGRIELFPARHEDEAWWVSGNTVPNRVFKERFSQKEEGENAN